ncbi:MAG: NfeD family protein, partial [Pseudomonadota bacterium]
GLALIALGLTFMTVEALSPSFGVFGVGGILAFGFGASILVDTDLPAYQISPALIIALTLTSAAFFALVLRLIVRAQKGPARTGANALLGMEAVVLDWAEGRGHVRLHGERWNAEGPEALPEGTRTTVKAVDGLTVTLDPPKDTPS